ncbi:MAG: T9SS type A sorting domain-containing protein [Paludibacteraceae bacterium]|nr:T9SS type A sorting domain-containing protein [Paludibacteraceae bacterium]
MRNYILGLLLLLSSTALAHDGYLSFNDGFVSQQEFGVQKSIKEGKGYIEVTYHIAGAYIDNFKQDGAAYTKIEIPNTHTSAQKGCPELPYLTERFALASDKNVRVKVVSSTYRDYQSFNIRPSAGGYIPGQKGVAHTEGAAYRKNAFYPSQSAGLIRLDQHRSIPVATVQLQPVAYNPATKTLRCYSSITYRITYDKGTAAAPAHAQNLEVVKSMVSNPQTIDQMTAGGKTLKAGGSNAGNTENIVIVSTTQYHPAVAKLMEWKSMQGYRCTLLEREDWTTNQLLDSLQKHYQKEVPSFLTIVGDQEDVPAIYVQLNYIARDEKDSITENSWHTIYTDHYYSNSEYVLGARDSLKYEPDIVSGRISVRNLEQAQQVIGKIIKYEKTPPTASSYYQASLHCADFQNEYEKDKKKLITSNDDWLFITVSEHVKNMVENNSAAKAERIYTIGKYDEANPPLNMGDGTPFPEEYYNKPDNWKDNNKVRLDIRKSINEGKNYVLYCGHGGEDCWAAPFFNTHDIHALNASTEPTFVFGQFACLTGSFGNNEECFAEAFLRKEHGGAVGIPANSAVAWWPYAADATENLIKSIYEDGELCVAKALNNVWMQNDIKDGAYPQRLHQSTISHYFGDPTMRLYTKEPSCFSPTIRKEGNIVMVFTNEDEESKIVLTSAENPADYSKMMAVKGKKGYFYGVDYPYNITIQKDHFVPYIITSEKYIQNDTLKGENEITGYEIVAGKNVDSLKATGAVRFNNADVTFKANKSVRLKPGFSVKANNSHFVANAKGGRCNYNGTPTANTVNPKATTYIYTGPEEEEAQPTTGKSQLVYPNPTTGRITVQCEEAQSTITIRDLLGNMVRQQKNANGNVEIDLGGLPKGIYTVKIEGDEHVYTRKVVLK